MSSQLQSFGISIAPQVPWEVRRHLEMMYRKIGNHAQAISLLSKQTGTTPASSTTVIEGVSNSPGGGSPGVAFGAVNDQTGQTAYTTVVGDDGALVVLNDAAAIAVTLNSAVTPPWMCFFTNQGAGTATLTPETGTISSAGNTGAASLSLLSGYGCLVFFDGTNFWAWTLPIVPVTTAAVAKQWLASYDAATGQFTQTQPAFSDIIGTAAPGQIPAATNAAQGAIQLAGDIGGTAASPQVTGTHLTAPLPVNQGGTGSTNGQSPTSGATSARPVGPAVGFQYFDTTLGKPVWYTGAGTTNWVDATGASA